MAPQEQFRQPNVIWVFGDQHRGQALSWMGDTNVNTPNIDRMCRDGAHFPSAVAGFPLCCPFRGSLVSGLYPHKCVPAHEAPMDPDTPTIAHALKSAGYHTAYFGKWHLDGLHQATRPAGTHIVKPERRGGFDEWVGYENNNSQWDCYVHGGEGAGAFQHRLEGYETDCMTDLLIRHLHDRASVGKGQPFFAALSVQPPHDPYVAPAEYMARHNAGRVEMRRNVPPVDSIEKRARRSLAGYYAQIENLDYNLGRIIESLDRLGLAEDTYVMFFSDHGDMHGCHGQFRKMTPHEEAIRIPFVVWKRDLRDYGRFGDETIPVNHVDIAPTTLGLCGVDVPEAMEGTDYSPWVREDRERYETPESAYLQSVIPTEHSDSVDRPWRGVVTRDGWKYVCLEHQPWMLFNLNEDPYELANHALDSRYWGQRKRLQGLLVDWLERTGDIFPLPELP